MAVIETWLTQDLQKPVSVNHLNGNLFSNNGNANRIGVILTDNGEPVTISGTVSGYAVTADGSTVPCTGTKSGNKASILVPAAAYQPGQIFITVFITDGTTVTTVGAVSSNVMRSRTNAQVDPGSVVTDWTQTINAAMQSVETAAANLGGIVAVPYASITFPVPLGKYTYYNNNLYRCISPIASSESFTAAHWTQVRLGDDVSDLKSALMHTVNVTSGDILSGYVRGSDGLFIESEYYLHTALMKMDGAVWGNCVSVDCSLYSAAGIAFYDFHKKYISGYDWDTLKPAKGKSGLNHNLPIPIPTNAYYIATTLLLSDYSEPSDFVIAYAKTYSNTDDKDKSILSSILTVIEQTSGDIKNGYVKGSTGEFVSSEYYKRTGYIDLKGAVYGTKVYINCSFVSNAGMAFYKEDKTYNGGYNESTKPDGTRSGYNTDVGIIIPDGTRYIAFTIETTNYSSVDDFILKYFSTRSNDTIKLEEKTNELSNLALRKVTIQSQDVSDGYVKGTTGEFVSANGYKRTGKVDISGCVSENKIRLTCSFVSGAGMAFYNSNGDYIEGYDWDNNKLPGVVYGRINDFYVDIPTNTKYVALTIYGEYYASADDFLIQYMAASSMEEVMCTRKINNFEQGIPSNKRNTTRVSAYVGECTAGHLDITLPSSLQCWIYIYDSTNYDKILSQSTNWYVGRTVISIENGTFPVVALCKKNYQEITVEDAEDCDICFINTLKDAINERSNEPIYKLTRQFGIKQEYALPDYYKDSDYIDSKCERINNLSKACGASGDAFLFLTDLHWSKNAKVSPALVNYIYEKTHINKIFMGGDYSDAKNIDDAYSEVATVFNDAWRGKLYYSMGNHEYLGSGSDGITTDENLAYFFESYYGEEIVYGSKLRNYFYVNNSSSKIRYIFLNRYSESVTSGETASDGLEQAQMTWFNTVAMNVENGWGIVIILHNIVNYTVHSSTEIEPYITEGAQDLVDSLENYSGNGEIICVISGHAHLDFIATLPNGIANIISTCDKNKSSGETPIYPDYWSDRADGTINEQAIDAFVIDRTNREIHVVRVGTPAMTWTKSGDSYVRGDDTQERVINYGT